MKSLSRFALMFVSVLALSSCDSWDNPLTGPSAAPSAIQDSNQTNAGENSSYISDLTEAARDLNNIIQGNGIPERVNGVELNSIRGWLANLYPWDYNPEDSTVHPVPRLWTPYQRPTMFQLVEQCRQLNDFGSGGVVLEYNPNPNIYDHNYWLSTNFANGCGPFLLLWEHINGTRFIPADGGSKDMNNPHNRQIFKDDLDFMFRNVICPNNACNPRYITVNGRAVVYMWASSQMTGDFATLLEEVKKEYPVFFIGSGEVWGKPNGAENINRVKALDGFMEYTLGGRNNYLRAVQDYNRASFSWRSYLRKLEVETGKRHVFIPTFQAAYDDTKVRGRTNPPMYARSRDEVKYHAEMIRSGMGNVYDFSVGPFVVYGELPEGAAVIESQCLPATVDTSGRFVGCGTARLQILKEYFGGW